jgi:TldD protein
MRLPAFFLAACLSALAQTGSEDPILRALAEELERSKTLRLAAVEEPYYAEYGIDDLQTFGVVCSQGAVISSNTNRLRLPRVQLRVGDYAFDNTNYVFSDFFGRIGGVRLPLDDDPFVLRHHFWLLTDRAFKGSVEAISRKRAALRNVTVQEELKDFAKAQPVTLILPDRPVSFQKEAWTQQGRALSALLSAYPTLTGSQLEWEAAYSTSYYLNTEGTRVRYPDDLFTIRVRAAGQAADGMPVRDMLAVHARSASALPQPLALERMVKEMAGNLTALLAAPTAEDYSGPVLVEGAASPQLFAQLIGSNLGLTRKPVSEPGRTPPVPSSELEGRIGSRILPEWIDVVDDPSQQEYRGHELLGHYPVDMEGVVPEPLTVIAKGTVSNFLLTRQPVRGFEGSNGRARLPGAFGAKTPVFSNLFVKARQTSPSDALKKKLIEMIGQRGKPYGLIIRKLDFPTNATPDELRRLSAASGQRGAALRLAASPLLAYRIYADGREELVRGLRFRGLNVRSLRDIIAASDTENIFDFIGNGTSLPMAGMAGYVSGHTVIAPSVLFEDLELDRVEEDWPRLPLVPPPALLSAR